MKRNLSIFVRQGKEISGRKQNKQNMPMKTVTMKTVKCGNVQHCRKCTTIILKS